MIFIDVFIFAVFHSVDSTTARRYASQPSFSRCYGTKKKRIRHDQTIHFLCCVKKGLEFSRSVSHNQRLRYNVSVLCLAKYFRNHEKSYVFRFVRCRMYAQEYGFAVRHIMYISKSSSSQSSLKHILPVSNVPHPFR